MNYSVSVEPLDECCKQVHLFIDGKEVNSGVYCPRSMRFVMDGEIYGFYETEAELLKRLRPKEVTRIEWGGA